MPSSAQASSIGCTMGLAMGFDKVGLSQGWAVATIPE
jgi:hypothetical protein